MYNKMESNRSTSEETTTYTLSPRFRTSSQENEDNVELKTTRNSSWTTRN